MKKSKRQELKELVTGMNKALGQRKKQNSQTLSSKKGCGKLVEEKYGVKISCGDFNGKVLCEECSNKEESK